MSGEWTSGCWGDEASVSLSLPHILLFLLLQILGGRASRAFFSFLSLSIGMKKERVLGVKKKKSLARWKRQGRWSSCCSPFKHSTSKRTDPSLYLIRSFCRSICQSVCLFLFELPIDNLCICLYLHIYPSIIYLSLSTLNRSLRAAYFSQFISASFASTRQPLVR